MSFRRRPVDAAGQDFRLAAGPQDYVKVGFRAGHPEVSPRNRLFAAIGQTGGFGEGRSSPL